MFRDVKVLQSRNGECGLDGNRLVRWSGILLYFSCLTGVATRSVVSPVLGESPPFYEGLDGVLEVDTVFSQMAMAPMVLTVFSPVHPGLGRSWSGALDTAILKSVLAYSSKMR